MKADNDTEDSIIKELEERWERFRQILRSGCTCFQNKTVTESTECDVCKKARENIQ